MRILHVVHQYFPEHVGGTEAHTRDLAKAQMDAGHDVTVFSRRYGDGRYIEQQTEDGVRVVRAVDGPFAASRRFTDGLRQPYLSNALADALGTLRPDVVHVQHAMGLPAGALARIGPEIAMVGTLHDYWWVCANAQAYTGYDGTVCDGPRWWLNCARCGIERLGHGRAWPVAPLLAPVFAARNLSLRGLRDRIGDWIAPSSFVREWHVRRGWPQERTVVVRHGIEPPPDDALRAASGRRRGHPARTFAYLGGLSVQKGVHLLVDAFNDLPSDATLTIAGDESVFPAYCRSLADSAAHPGVRFVGLLSHADVWRTLAAADVLVVPSVWYETSSLIAQEALAVGTPVVTTDHGALAERVQHGVNGLRVAPNDMLALRGALQRLAHDPDLLDSLRQTNPPIRTIAEAALEIEACYRQARRRAPR
jgi:glycosyltransferase involved in cell wall biosynthesis